MVVEAAEAAAHGGVQQRQRAEAVQAAHTEVVGMAPGVAPEASRPAVEAVGMVPEEAVLADSHRAVEVVLRMTIFLSFSTRSLALAQRQMFELQPLTVYCSEPALGKLVLSIQLDRAMELWDAPSSFAPTFSPLKYRKQAGSSTASRFLRILRARRRGSKEGSWTSSNRAQREHLIGIPWSTTEVRGLSPPGSCPSPSRAAFVSLSMTKRAPAPTRISIQSK